MKILKKSICVALVAFMMISALSMPSAATDDDSQTYEKNPTTDFVLIVDCSNSIPGTDPYHLCETACKMLMDMLPLENARIAVIGFASKRVGEKYVLDNRDYFECIEDKDTREYAAKKRDIVLQEAEKVRLIVPLTPISELRKSGLDAYKTELENAIEQQGKGTFIGMSTVAAVDLLEKSGATPGNACIIVLSDGDNATVKLTFEPRVDIEMQKYIAKVSGDKDHKWPMYALQVNAQGNRDESNWKEDLQRMLQMAVDSGAGGENTGRFLLGDFSKGSQQIAKAFLGIFDRFMGNEGKIETAKIDESGRRTDYFTINDIVSEATIVAAGEGVHEITLQNGNTLLSADTSRFEVTAENIASSDYIISGEPGRYICVKLICPEPGEWTATFSGDKNTEFVVYQCSMTDMDIALGCSRDLSKIIEQKDDEIWLNAVFQYHGKDVQPSQYAFEKMPAMFYAVDNSNGDTVELDDLEISATPSGYKARITMNYLLNKFFANEGSYDIFLRVENEMFRDNHKVSNKLGPFKTIDEHIAKIKEIGTLEGFTNRGTAQIYLPDYIENKDGDELSYELTCDSDRTKKFLYSTEDDTFAITNCEQEVAEFKMVLTAKEPSGYSLDYPFTLKVKNNLPTFPGTLPEISLKIKPIGEKDVTDETVINLEEFYQDDDGDPAIFADFDFGGDDQQVFEASFEENKKELTVKAINSGEHDIHFTVSDGYCDPIPITISVKVTSGVEELIAKILSFWPAYLAALILLVAFLVIRQLSKVKGKWNFKIVIGDERNNCAQATVDIHSNTRIGRKRPRFLLKELFFGKKKSDRDLSSKLVIIQEESEKYIKTQLPKYFERSGAEKIYMKGFIGKDGFELSNWKARSVDVAKNGSTVLNKVSLIKLRNGTPQSIKIRIPDPSLPEDKNKDLFITIS